MAHYGWGDDSGSSRVSTSTSRKKGVDYKSARKAYDTDAEIGSTPLSGRSGSMRSASVSTRSGRLGYDKSRVISAVGLDVSTESTHPIVVIPDFTGSMASNHKIMLDKLPLFGEEVKRYAPEYAISFCAYGDAYCDCFPIQPREFGSGMELDDHISAIYPEGGGGDDPENPDLAAYFYLNHCKIDKAVKPILMILTDTRSHTTLRKSAIKKWIGDDAQSDLDSKTLLKRLGDKFSVYVLNFGGNHAKKYWTDIYGAQRVKPVEEARDLIELMIAVVAGECGELKDFEMRSSKRHEDKPDRVDRVMKSVKTGLSEKDPEDAGKAKSTSKKSGKSMKSKKLV